MITTATTSGFLLNRHISPKLLQALSLLTEDSTVTTIHLISIIN